MDCGCLVDKIGYVVTITKVYVQSIRSTTRRYFRGRQTLPHENVYIRKINLQKKRYKTRKLNEKNIWTTRIKLWITKRSHCHCCWEESSKGLNLCWRYKAIAEPKSAPQKIKILRGQYM